MKIVLIIYGIVAVVWFIAVVYSSYKDKYRLEWQYRGTNLKTTIDWAKIIVGVIFWPIDILVCLIKAIAKKNS